MNSDPIDPTAQYLWVPGHGPDAGAAARLFTAFPKPRIPMGEAWFMGERKMFPELGGDLEALSFEDLARPLEELISGPTSFGPFEEWTAWYHYLMPRLLHRGHEGAVWGSMLEFLVTGFFSQHPHSDAPEPYAGFRRDALRTLGRVLMTPSCWPNGRIDYRTCLAKEYFDGVDRWFWEQASGKLSSSLFLCLKYLPPEALKPWLTSVLAIRSTHWRAQLMVWFIGAHGMLCGKVNQPGDLAENAHPPVSWGWSHCLQGDHADTCDESRPDAIFLPEANRSAALEVVRDVLTEPLFEHWLSSLSRYGYLERELGDLPFDFWALYAK